MILEFADNRKRTIKEEECNYSKSFLGLYVMLQTSGQNIPEKDIDQRIPDLDSDQYDELKKISSLFVKEEDKIKIIMGSISITNNLLNQTLIEQYLEKKYNIDQLLKLLKLADKYGFNFTDFLIKKLKLKQMEYL